MALALEGNFLFLNFDLKVILSVLRSGECSEELLREAQVVLWRWCLWALACWLVSALDL